MKTLTRVPGIGPKVAQRMVLELKDKVGAPAAAAAPPAAAEQRRQPAPRQVVEALLGLGFTAKPAEAAVDAGAGRARRTPTPAPCCAPPSPSWAGPGDRPPGAGGSVS